MSSPLVAFRSQKSDLIQIAPAHNERLRPSRFNARRVVEDKGLILFNTFTGALAIFKSAMRPNVEALLSKTGVPRSSDPLLEYLLERGFLVPEGTNELNKVRYAHGTMHHRTDKMELILLSSEECNFRCTYCYEDFPRGTMEPWVREAVVRWVERKIRFLSTMKIDWFGGEPLLGFEAIRDIAPKVQALCRQHDVQFLQGMTTNAYLLTPDVFTSLVSWGLHDFQITIDGPQITHDTTRILKDGGGGTYDTIIENLRKITTLPGDCTLTVRINFSPENLPYIDEHLETMKAYFAHDPRFKMRFYPVSKWGGKNDNNLNTCGMSATETTRQLEVKALKTGLQSDGRLERISPGSDLALCYAARPYNFIVGADGKLMKCTLALDKHDYNIVGTLQPDGRPEVKLDKLVKWVAPYFEDDAGCQKCFFLPVCQGISCPLERIENNARPCPSEKFEIGPTLEAIWVTEKLRKKKGAGVMQEKALVGPGNGPANE
jgi:uncharacterized protein